ncbi:MAG: hypothetical protein ABIG61_11425 [Planctomycetota bacterium]
MKKMVVTSAVILLVAVTMASAQEAQESELHGSIDITYLSKYIWRGFDIYGDKSAIQPSIDLDLFGTGFGVNIMAHRANSSGYEDGERWDYTLYYGNSVFEDEVYATNYRLAYVYYNYPDVSSHNKTSLDLQEAQALFSWPNILPIKGLVPSYVLVKLWPSSSGTPVGCRSASGGTASGFAHIFMLDYGLHVQDLGLESTDQVLNLHSEMIYNDGVGPNGANVDHDWSNVVFGISTDFELGNGFVFTPGVYHQITLDTSVNDDKDETWVSLNFKYKF